MAASQLLDGCKFNPTLGGTTDWTYSSFVVGYQSPAAANVVNGAQYSYRAESADLSQWEFGTGTYNTSTGVLTRATVLYSYTGGTLGTSKVSFSTVPTVAIVALKEDLPALASANAFSNTTASTSTTTGALTVAGGVGVGGAVNAGGAISTVVDPAIGWSFDGSGTVAYTLINGATVAFPVGSGLILVRDETNGDSGVYLVAGTTVNLISSIGTTFISGVSSGKAGVYWNGTSFGWNNNVGATHKYHFTLVRTYTGN